MCGIAGFIDFNMVHTISDLKVMTDSIKHRGPDGEGHKIWKEENVVVGFGHRRLAIIDLSENGAQPMVYSNVAVTYNGEIYNFKEIKKELQELNYTFNTNSDTEVIIQAYRAWGPQCVHKFIGMFAFVLYDINTKLIYFFRDRSGVKPLYVYEKNGLLLFSSELKAFHTIKLFEKELNSEAVTLYFKYGYVPDYHCIFKYCYKVEPGSYIKLNLRTKESSSVRYWNPFAFHVQTVPIDKSELHSQINELLISAFQYRMVADVPVGVFLSGGYDSSLVAAILQKYSTGKIRTFNIGFEDSEYDESGYADQVARYLGTDHLSILCTAIQAQEIIPDLTYYYDEPFADSSQIPTFLVSKMTTSHVKVALSADGGDELFGGYARKLKILKYHKNINKIPLFARKVIGEIGYNAAKTKLLSVPDRVKLHKLSLMFKDPSIENIFDLYLQYYSNKLLSEFISKDFYESDVTNIKKIGNNFDTINSLLLLEYNSTLSNDMLVKVDRATMANSLEGREPLLDHRIFEYLATIPSDYKIQNGELKILLKELTHKYIPREIMHRPKKGFGVPVSYWLKNDLKDLTLDVLSQRNINKFGVLNHDPVMTEIQKQMATNDSNDQLWLFFNFQMWCEKWL
jgi:asparagine synthase (glutamine-hydrolysing)